MRRTKTEYLCICTRNYYTHYVADRASKACLLYLNDVTRRRWLAAVLQKAAPYLHSTLIQRRFYRTTRVSWYQNVSILDFIGAKDKGIVTTELSLYPYIQI